MGASRPPRHALLDFGSQAEDASSLSWQPVTMHCLRPPVNLPRVASHVMPMHDTMSFRSEVPVEQVVSGEKSGLSHDIAAMYVDTLS